MAGCNLLQFHESKALIKDFDNLELYPANPTASEAMRGACNGRLLEFCIVIFTDLSLRRPTQSFYGISINEL